MNILAIGAHPDDIEFGCGGTLLKYAQAGHDITLFVLTDGGFGGEPQRRRDEQHESARLLKAQGVMWGDLPDTELVDNRQLIVKIDEAVHKVKPDLVFLNYLEDVHQDHRALAQAGTSATRYVREVLFYEVPTTHHFEPDIFVDIQDVLEKKLELSRANQCLLIKPSQIRFSQVPIT